MNYELHKGVTPYGSVEHHPDEISLTARHHNELRDKHPLRGTSVILIILGGAVLVAGVVSTACLFKHSINIIPSAFIAESGAVVLIAGLACGIFLPRPRKEKNSFTQEQKERVPFTEEEKITIEYITSDT